jgi:hypothetical protein
VSEPGGVNKIKKGKKKEENNSLKNTSKRTWDKPNVLSGDSKKKEKKIID